MNFFVQYHALTILVSGLRVVEKARKIALKLSVSNECFSTGWLRKFKMRDEILSQETSRDFKDVPAEKVEEWFKNLPNIMDGYKQRNIYNVDENGLF